MSGRRTGARLRPRPTAHDERIQVLLVMCLPGGALREVGLSSHMAFASFRGGVVGELIVAVHTHRDPSDAEWSAYYAKMFSLPDVPIDAPPAKVAFEVCYQARRAFHALHTTLRGVSTEAGKLRARVWNACFPGGDLMRYARGGYERRNGAHILILGDTGTGKELVARALARARYLPYSETDHRFAGGAKDGAAVAGAAFAHAARARRGPGARGAARDDQPRGAAPSLHPAHLRRGGQLHGGRAAARDRLADGAHGGEGGGARSPWWYAPGSSWNGPRSSRSRASA